MVIEPFTAGFCGGILAGTVTHYGTKWFITERLVNFAKEKGAYYGIKRAPEIEQVAIPSVIGGIVTSVLENNSFSLGLKAGMTLASVVLSARHGVDVSIQELQEDKPELLRYCSKAARDFQLKGLLKGGLNALSTLAIIVIKPSYSFIPYCASNYLAYKTARFVPEIAQGA